jgi:hypothetical protein
LIAEHTTWRVNACLLSSVRPVANRVSSGSFMSTSHSARSDFSSRRLPSDSSRSGSSLFVKHCGRLIGLVERCSLPASQAFSSDSPGVVCNIAGGHINPGCQSSSGVWW